MQRALAILSLMLSTQFQSPRRWGGVGLTAHAEGHGANLGQRVSIPSEVGRGRADPSGKPCSTPSCLVSIPSEVGRGRARPRGTNQLRRAWDRVSIPSEVGRALSGSSPIPGSTTRRFNPLGGGAGSGSQGMWTPMPNPTMRFNPLGGGAGSGSGTRSRSIPGKNGSFNPLRRWGGVGLLTSFASNRPFL